MKKMAAGIMMACLLFQVPQIPTYGAKLETNEATADIELEGKVLKNNMSVTVVVHDAKSLAKLSEATVALEDWSNYAITNRRGEVTLTGLIEQQVYKIFVGRGGHESKLIDYLCVEDGAVLNVYLEKDKGGGGGGGGGGNTPGGGGGSNDSGPGFDPSESEPGGLTPGEDGSLVPGESDGVVPGEDDDAANNGQNGANGGQNGANGGQNGANGGQNGANGGQNGANGTGGQGGANGEDGDGRDSLIDEMANGRGGITDEPSMPDSGAGIWKQITREDIEKAVETGEPLVIEAGQGGVDPLRTGTFNQHDLDLLGDNEFWAKHTAADGWSLIVVNEAPKEEPLVVRQAKIPHSIMNTAREKNADVQVLFREGDDGGAAALFPAGFFNKEDMADKDLFVELDPKTGSMSMTYSLTVEHNEARKLTISENSLAFAAGKGFDLKAKIYNPADDDEFWYEWKFNASDLAQAQIFETDLYINNDNQDIENVDNPLKSLRIWRRTQLFTINHHGALPAPASLRVKNLAGFPAQKTVSYRTFNTEEGKADTLYTNVGFDEEGFAVIPRMDHCSSYALAGAIWWWWYVIAAAIIAAVAGLIYYFVKRKKNRSAVMNEVWVASQDDDDDKSKTGEASKIINMEANKANKAVKADNTNNTEHTGNSDHNEKAAKVSGGEENGKNSEEDK